MEYKYITSESLEFLKQLLNTPSTSGGEKEIAKLYSKYMEPYGNTIIDNMHNSCCVINPTSEFKVMLDAHYDEECKLYISQKMDSSTFGKTDG